jgi:hypothetical protein
MFSTIRVLLRQTYTWDAHLVASGNHVITATARDKAGNAGHSASVTVLKE